jgi:hypothetical protein
MKLLEGMVEITAPAVEQDIGKQEESSVEVETYRQQRSLMARLETLEQCGGTIHAQT